MTAPALFDVRQSVVGRTIIRLIVGPAFSIGFIVLGINLLPKDFVWAASTEAIETWSGWAFAGIILIGSGIFGLIKEALFALKTRGLSGEWHFRLTEDELLWHVPDHAHGPETGFKARLEELKEIEFRTIQKYEEMDEREYWVHFRDRDPVQLRSHSGISISWLVSLISDAGVNYTETVVEE